VPVSVAQLNRELERIVLFLEQRQIPYLLIGGLALSLWGRPRTTLDLDFLIQVEERDLVRLQREAGKEKFKVDRHWGKWNPSLRTSQIRLRLGKVAVDLLLPRDAHNRAAFDNRRRCKVGKKYFSVVAPEDFVLQKLKVGRPRDFEDAVTVLERMKGELNKSYLRKWAKKLRVVEELNYILSF